MSIFLRVLTQILLGARIWVIALISVNAVLYVDEIILKLTFTVDSICFY